jgi:hypothetical protein
VKDQHIDLQGQQVLLQEQREESLEQLEESQEQLVLMLGSTLQDLYHNFHHMSGIVTD